MQMHYVYILYSEQLDRFYVGQTHDVYSRLSRHNGDYYEGKWTAKGKPWTLFLEIECLDKRQALDIEGHIKRMKSSQYIRNLAHYPEIIEKLKKKYPGSADG